MTEEPYAITDDTWVLPQRVPAPFVGHVYVNSLIILAEEPVIVDTGTPAHRTHWLEQAWSIVDPEDVRWVFLSHDDGDHTGALTQVLAACPNARLVTNWFSLGRLEVGQESMPPLHRCVWVNDDESFDAGDRTLVAIRPPLFDAPTTRGLFDSRTGVYWSADCFGAFVPHAAQRVEDLARDDWAEGFFVLNRVNHPWHLWLDPTRWAAHVDRVRELEIRTIATAHGPVIDGQLVDDAFDMLHRIPEMEAWPVPRQADLETLLSSQMREPEAEAANGAG